MKRFIAIVLALLLLISLAACSANNNDADGEPNSDSGGQQDGNTNPSGSIVGVKSDVYAPNAGSQADKYWHVKEIQTVYEFDGDGKCTVRDNVYYLKNASDYEDAKDQLEGGGWTVVWNADKTGFKMDQGFKDYTTVDDAIDEMEKEFRGYTLTYSNGGTKYVAPPTDERKTELMKEVFGFTFDEIETAFGDYTYSYTRQRDKVMVTYISNATTEDINALARAAYEVCAPLADEGKMYNYLGKYGTELTEAPTTDSIFMSAAFHYFKDGKEISVESEILNSEGYNNTLALLVAVVS